MWLQIRLFLVQGINYKGQESMIKQRGGQKKKKKVKKENYCET